MRVLALMGSPRMGGNTDILVSEFLRGAESVGAQIEKVALAKLKIKGCRACERCHDTGRCHIKDDMQPLYDKLLAADVVVLGTPIYFWGPSAQFKPFVDRWYALDQPGIREKLAGKRCQLICAFADAGLETATPTVSMLQTGATYMGFEWQQPILGASLGARGEAAQRPELLQAAFAAGTRLGR
jgi:multimeric flavodoxin WrbA